MPGPTLHRLPALGLGLLFAFASGAGLFAEEKPKRPNILLILADDMGWGDLSLHGNRDIQTPNLEALAAGGARLEHFYACPDGATTTASLLTGRYHYRTGVSGSTHGESFLPDHETTFAELLKNDGWATTWLGKWQNGVNWPHRPEAQGFDQFVGFCGESRTSMRLETDNQPDPDQTLTPFLFSEALRFIEKSPQPWLCVLALDEPQHSATDDPKGVAGAIGEIDHEFGLLRKALQERQLENDTLIWFLSDSGPATLPDSQETRYNAFLRGAKGSVHEGGVRIPSLIRWPAQIPEATEFDRIGSVIDVLPTLVDFAGIASSPAPIDGMSLAPALRSGGEPRRWPNRILSTSWTPPGFLIDRASVAVRTDRWVALRDPNWRRGELSETHSGWELYDLDADPFQRFEVAEDYPYLLSDMRADFSRWMDHTTDDGLGNLPTEIGHPEWPVVTLRPEFVPWKLKPKGNEFSWPVKVVSETAEYRIEIDLAPDAPEKKGRFHFFVGNAETIVDVSAEESRDLISVGKFRLEPVEFFLRVNAVKDASAIERIRAIRIVALE